jgi:hypothetical protein
VDTPRPSPRTNRTRRVPHPVLTGHAAIGRALQDWAQPNEFLGKPVRHRLVGGAARNKGRNGTVSGWLPAAESDYYPDGDDKPPQPLWRIRFDDPKTAPADLDWQELEAALAARREWDEECAREEAEAAGGAGAGGKEDGREGDGPASGWGGGKEEGVEEGMKGTEEGKGAEEDAGEAGEAGRGGGELGGAAAEGGGGAEMAEAGEGGGSEGEGAGGGEEGGDE